MTKLENVLVWLYVKTWGKFGEHVINEKSLWNFSAEDFRMVLMELAYPTKKEKSERVKTLTDLIMGQFEEGGLAALREWSGDLHAEIIETLSENVQPETQVAKSQPQRKSIKILKWDSGSYSLEYIDNIVHALLSISI